MGRSEHLPERSSSFSHLLLRVSALTPPAAGRAAMFALLFLWNPPPGTLSPELRLPPTPADQHAVQDARRATRSPACSSKFQGVKDLAVGGALPDREDHRFWQQPHQAILPKRAHFGRAAENNLFRFLKEKAALGPMDNHFFGGMRIMSDAECITKLVKKHYWSG